MKNYQTFAKDNLKVTLSNDDKVAVPQYVDKARIRYRYDADENILYKQCFTCANWFKIAKYENDDWSDIHDENEIHKVKSGYGSYCKACDKSNKNLNSENKNSSIKNNSNSEKCSVFMEESHRKYLKARSALEDKSMRQLLYEILQSEIQERPLDKFL